MALPPGPRTPGLVNTVRFGRKPLEMLRQWHTRYGDLITAARRMVEAAVNS
jgi:hypothetical protein